MGDTIQHSHIWQQDQYFIINLASNDKEILFLKRFSMYFPSEISCLSCLVSIKHFNVDSLGSDSRVIIMPQLFTQKLFFSVV